MNSKTGIPVEAMVFPGLMPAWLLVSFLDQVKLLTVLKSVLMNTKLKITGTSKYGPISAWKLPPS